MKDDIAADAAGYFSENVREFDQRCERRPGVRDPVEVRDNLLMSYAVPAGLALRTGRDARTCSFRLAAHCHRVAGFDGAPFMRSFCDAKWYGRGLKDDRLCEGRLPSIDETWLVAADLMTSSSVVEYLPRFNETLARLWTEALSVAVHRKNLCGGGASREEGR
jgi:hypothetical protein